MGTSRRHFFTGRASGALLLGWLAFACSDEDFSFVDPSALDGDPEGWGGASGQLNSNVDAGSEGGAAGEAGAAGAAGTGEPPDSGTPPDPTECSVAFVTPSADEVPLTFGPADDQDGTPCGSAFTTNVVVSSSGATVTLFADDAPVATEAVSGTSASFEGVLLGSRAPATSTLRAVATMSDGRTCEASVGSLGVDCAGPSCTLTGPNTNPWLTTEDDLSPGTGGLQTNFTLQTDASDGTEARLFLNGDTGNPLLATVQSGNATFANVTLAEGPSRSVQGECRDTAGNVTLSAVASWAVTLAECEVEITSPVPGPDPLTLGPGDDQDGEACGSDFTTSVAVDTNAASVALQVDGQPVDTLSVTGSSVQFTDVILGTRTPSSSTITVVATMADGRTCSASRESIIVDCEGPSCTLVAASNDPFLNVGNDQDLVSEGLQTSFRVDTNPENVDQDVRLILDGDEGTAETEVFDANGLVASATFAPVTLAEGNPRTVQAECEDDLGNVTRSSELSWDVDLTPCTITIDSVANDADPITRVLDEVPGGDIQVNVVGSVSGAGCTGVRVGVCGEPLGSFDGAVLDGSGNWTLPVTLADVSGEGEICAEVQDSAENVTQDQVLIEVRSEDPIVEVASPLDGSSINVAGGAGITADLDTLTAACEAEVVVNCTDVGAAVTLIVDGAPLSTPQLCVSDSNALPPYQGTATFASVSFSELSSTHTIAAEQTVGGLTGTSAAITVNTDCVAPVVAISDPLCGGQLHLVDDDENGGDPGLQYSVAVNNDGVPDVSLAVAGAGGTDNLNASGNATTTTFAGVDFGDPGDVTLTATATDAAGNVGTSAACLVTVVVEPTVNILAPTAAQLLSTADDCDPDGGYGVLVTGTTNAPAGSTVEVAIGTGLPVALEPVVDGGGGPNTFSGCVAIADGANQLITVLVTDSPNPAGSDTVTVNVDTAAPTDSVPAPAVSVTNRRAGQVTFTWAHVADSDGSTLAAYEMRCAATQIGNETAWEAARQLTVNTVGAAVGSADASELIPDPGCSGDFCRGFRVGTTEFCVIRGRDGAGLLTPLTDTSSNVAVTVPFTETLFTGVSNGASAFTNVIGVGDVNGDGGNDMLYSVTNQPAQLVFGGASFDTTVDVTFSNPATGAGFGAAAAALGDINGDTIPDFAISARNLNTTPVGGGAGGGMVYIFFGKAGAWPAAVTVNPSAPTVATGCGADVCLVGGATGAFLGWDLTGTDFDGDGVNDVVVSARAADALVGTVYVLLGGTQFQVAAGTSINLPSGNPNGFVLTPPASRSNFGSAIAALGAGLDGRGDLAIAANAAGSANLGSLLFKAGESYPPATTGLIAPSASAVALIAEGSAGDFPSPVRSAGDFDGDGLGDLVLGRSSSAGGGLGVAQLYLQRQGLPFGTGLGILFDFAADGTADTDFGSSLANGHHPHAALGAVGDLDGDGFSELAVGSAAGATGGSVSLFYGSLTPASRLRSQADFTLSASSTSIMTPNYIGDFDGDGFRDLAVIDGGSGADRIILLR